MTGNTDFVRSLYPSLLGRAAGPGDEAMIAMFAQPLDSCIGTRQQTVRFLQNTAEAADREVRNLYNTFLLRTPDPQGGAIFRDAVLAGIPTEAIAAAFAGSNEYFATRANGTVDGFLQALYQDALGRSFDPVGRAAFTAALAGGLTRTQVATLILTSNEARQRLVQGFYTRFLNRAADPGGLDANVAALQAGVSQRDQIATFLLSDEYFVRFAGQLPGCVLVADEVSLLLQRAAAASASEDGIFAIVDRLGRILGVRVEAGVSPAITGNAANLTFAVDGALAKARSAAFFANNVGPLTSRTVRNLSQTTITQREVESNPNITDINSTVRGPGFVAPVGVGGHFPPNIAFTPPVDLFGIEHINRDSLRLPGPDEIKGTADDITIANRFNVNSAFIPARIPAANRLVPPDSYGTVSGLLPAAQSRGIATLPGGIAIYKGGVHVGAIGVFFPGATGFATEENSNLSTTFNPARPDRSLEAEYIAFAALGGSSGFAASIGPLGGVALPANFDLPAGRIDLVGITLDIYGPGGTQGPKTLLQLGRSLGVGNPNSGINRAVEAGANPRRLLDGVVVPDGWLVTPHDGVGGLKAADVVRIVEQGIADADRTRSQIRVPQGQRTRLIYAVTDVTGEVLGLFRQADGLVDALDVTIAKARNAAYTADAVALRPEDRIPDVAPGAALTGRTYRFVAQPRFPLGIDGTPPGPWSILNDGGSDPLTGLNVGPPLPASAFKSVLGHDAFFPGTNFRDKRNLANQNGIAFFPGTAPLYKDINGDGIAELVGGLGVSGDGVDQNDVGTAASARGFEPPSNVPRADQVFTQGVRLPYLKFPRNPFG